MLAKARVVLSIIRAKWNLLLTQARPQKIPLRNLSDGGLLW